jgi:hypothetical protein
MDTATINTSTTTKPIRTTRRGARRYVQSGIPFHTTNKTLFGRWVGTQNHADRAYVVYSYGPHWPLFVYYNGIWYENEDKRSVTTSHHRSYAHPLTDTALRSTTWLRGFIGE